MTLTLSLTLESDATPGRGDGTAGLVDAEIAHDPRTGLPEISGRAIKGLLVEECGNLLFAARRAAPDALGALDHAATFLFGSPGGLSDGQAALHVGPARLPDDLRAAVEYEIREGRLAAPVILDSLTAIRRQTALDARTGAPEDTSLRSLRVLLRQTTLIARLSFQAPPDDLALSLLASCASCVRRLGLGRNRGRGRVRVRLLDRGVDVTWARGAPLRALLEGGVS